ncbi:MAG: hypothetical protein KIT17_01605 [Rubrivivax sp.]|nr:hypothetical protein [Burkholderiales bacterium]MCW5632008.1 hypothetical protein [Rubrivivax sp.]
MRKLIFLIIVTLGASVGLLSAADDDAWTRAVMAVVGALFAAPIGAVLTRRRKPTGATPLPDGPIETSGSTSPRALASNYWRDKGHPPFMKPSEAEPDRHMFDPDRQA